MTNSDLHESCNKQLKLSEFADESLSLKFEDALAECEAHIKKIEHIEKVVKDYEKKLKDKEYIIKKKDEPIKSLIAEKDNVLNEISFNETKKKNRVKTINAKHKELHDLKNENVKMSENLLKIQSELNDMSRKAKKEEKSKKNEE